MNRIKDKTNLLHKNRIECPSCGHDFDVEEVIQQRAEVRSSNSENGMVRNDEGGPPMGHLYGPLEII